MPPGRPAPTPAPAPATATAMPPSQSPSSVPWVHDSPSSAPDYGGSDHDDEGTSVPLDEYGLVSDGYQGQGNEDEELSLADEPAQDYGQYREAGDDAPPLGRASPTCTRAATQPQTASVAPFISPEDEELLAHEPAVDPSHHWPLLAAAAPPLLTLFGGTADHWTNAVEIFLASFWLYQFLRSPWELYDAARTKRVVHADFIARLPLADVRVQRAHAAHLAQQAQHQASLQRAELLAFVWCILSPIIGAVILTWLRDSLSDGDTYINAFSIRLFIITAGIKPWMHAIRLVRRRILFLQKEVHYPAGRIEALTERIEQLEAELAQSRDEAVTREEMDALRSALDIPLARVVRAVRKASRREARAQATRADELARVDGQLAALAESTLSNTEQILLERKEREHWSALPGTLFQAIGTVMGQRYKSETPKPTTLQGTHITPASITQLDGFVSAPISASEPARTPDAKGHNVRHKRSSTWSEPRSAKPPARSPSPPTSAVMQLGHSVLTKARGLTGWTEAAQAPNGSHPETPEPVMPNASSVGEKFGSVRRSANPTPQPVPRLVHHISKASLPPAHSAHSAKHPAPPAQPSMSDTAVNPRAKRSHPRRLSRS